MAFWDVSLETANQLYAWGWRASIFGALVTFFGVGALSWGTRVRDRDFEENIARLHSRAAESERRSKELDESNLRLQRDAERERIERIKLEEKVAPRRLTGEQKAEFIAALWGLSIPPTVAVVSRIMDAEGTDFADDIATALREAGWTVERLRNWLMSTKGLHVGLAEGTTVPLTDPVISGLVRAIDAANGSPDVLIIKGKELESISPYFMPNVLYLLVGAKP